MNTKLTPLEDTLPPVANSDWPMLNENSKKRFTISRKKSDINIDAVTEGLSQISRRDDSYLEETDNTESSIKELLNTDKVVRPRIVKHNQVNDMGLFSQEHSASQPAVETPEIPLKEEIATNPSFIQTQTTPVAISSESESVLSQAQPEEKVQVNVLLKFLAIGFAHLYMKKTTSVLNPLKFVAENFSKVLMGLLHVLIPLGMTWYLTTQVPFVANRLALEGRVVHLVYSAIFYLPCLVVWITAQAVGAGIWGMIRNTLNDVAKVGKEKI